ncbi:MAG: putative transport system permease protein, partial [Actinomycetota bacterium]
LGSLRDPDLAAPRVTLEERAAHDGGAARVAAAIPGASVTALDIAINPIAAAQGRVDDLVQVVTPLDHGFRGVGLAYVATPQLLSELGIDASTIDPSSDLITSLSQTDVTLLDVAVRPGSGERPTAIVQRMPQLGFYTSAPKSLITEHAMAARGWTTARGAWLVQSDHPLTTAEIADARKAAAQDGFTIEVRSGQDDLAALRTGATVVGVLLALAIVAMAIGLLRGEAVADLRTLTATGASGTVRRALTASTAGALALAGVLLSTAGSYGALVAGYHADLDKLLPVPWANLAVLIVGLPLLATAAGWLLAGREPHTFARQLAD